MSKNTELGTTVQRPAWLLYTGIIFRAVHQIGAALFLASFFLGTVSLPPFSFTWLAVISGFFLLITEVYRHRQMHREVSGMLTITKCILVGMAVHQILPASVAVLLAFFLASVGAHLPKNIRHKMVY